MLGTLLLGWKHSGPNSVAVLTSVHRGMGLGGLQRAEPTGGNA